MKFIEHLETEGSVLVGRGNILNAGKDQKINKMNCSRKCQVVQHVFVFFHPHSKFQALRQVQDHH